MKNGPGVKSTIITCVNMNYKPPQAGQWTTTTTSSTTTTTGMGTGTTTKGASGHFFSLIFQHLLSAFWDRPTSRHHSDHHITTQWEKKGVVWALVIKGRTATPSGSERKAWIRTRRRRDYFFWLTWSFRRSGRARNNRSPGPTIQSCRTSINNESKSCWVAPTFESYK